MNEKQSKDAFMKVLKRHGIPEDVVESQTHRIKELSIQTEHFIRIKEDYFRDNKEKLEKIFKGVSRWKYAVMSNGVLYFNGDCMQDIVKLSESLDKHDLKKEEKPEDKTTTLVEKHVIDPSIKNAIRLKYMLWKLDPPVFTENTLPDQPIKKQGLSSK